MIVGLRLTEALHKFSHQPNHFTSFHITPLLPPSRQLLRDVRTVEWHVRGRYQSQQELCG